MSHPHAKTWLQAGRGAVREDGLHGSPLPRPRRRVPEGESVSFQVVEICAGAGGQAIGLERAGFEHALAVEIDGYACQTLRRNRPHWKVEQGDVADHDLWDPSDYVGVDLLAGGVPCPPFS